MGNIKIIGGVFDTKLELEHTGVAAGFPYTKKDGKGKADVFARSTSGRSYPKGLENAIKHDFRSPNPTTRWSDIIKLK